MREDGSSIIPVVIEMTRYGERAYDIFSRLLKDRIIFLGTPIDDQVANAVIAQLLFMEKEDNEKEVYLYINSPGGSVTSGLAIYDTMQYVRSKIVTLCVGQACSMAAVLLAAGTAGKRSILPNSRVMIHQLSGGTHGQAKDIEIQAREALRLKSRLNAILAKHTGKSQEAIEKDCDRDYFMDAEEAKSYGIVDEIVTEREP